MREIGSLRQLWHTLVNVLGYLLLRVTHLEGRFRWGRFTNWSRTVRVRPKAILRPTSIEELQRLVTGNDKLRVVGSGHSFNETIVTDGCLLSLDELTGIELVGDRRVRVKAGTRVRELTKWLEKRNLAIRALPSHDAQSIAGILATDVHGTGRDHGFVSDFVKTMTFVNGRGNIVRCTPKEDCFKATIGGLGATGVIAEVELEVVASFRLRQKTTLMPPTEVEAQWDRILKDHAHASLYVFPFSPVWQLNTWDPTDAPTSFLGAWREMFYISGDAFFGSVLNATARWGWLPRSIRFVSRFKGGTDLTLPSYEGFSRSIYHLHEELEFAVERDAGLPLAIAINDYYQKHYPERRFPSGFVELRVTPEHDCTFIGPGRGGPSAFLDVISHPNPGYRSFYREVMQLAATAHPRAHLGKHIDGLEKGQLRGAHQDCFARFDAEVANHDPEGKFSTPMLRALVG